MADGFLGRWAQRKNDALQGKPLDEPVLGNVAKPAGLAASAPAPASASAGTKAASAATDPGSSQAPALGAPPADAPPAEASAPLTLEDVEGLTKDSDFKPFMNQGVTPGVRNAAMKKLFADPHFNVMDRMDIYIDDYSQSDPIPAAMLRQMASAKFLKLFDDEDEEAAAKAATPAELAAGVVNPAEADAPPLARPDDAPEAAVATAATPSQPCSDNPQPANAPTAPDPYQDDHANLNLRLQPDHAPEGPGPGRGAA